MFDIHSIRLKKRQQCLSLTNQQQKRHAEKIQAQLLSLTLFQESHKIGFYIDDQGEVETKRIIESAWQAKKHCYLPSLHPQQKQLLLFLSYTTSTILHHNRYGIPEVPFHARQVCFPWELDIIILPLVTFDHHCHRIGRGAGFYDRTLCFKKYHKESKPSLIGLAHELQKIEKIEPNTWDVQLDYILTEKDIYSSK